MKHKNGGIFSGMDVFSSCRQLRQPSFSGVLEVRHAIKGRIRLSIPSLKRNLVGAENFKRQLTRLQGIETVSVNLFLGTVLITYNPRILNQLLVISASTHCFDFDRQLEQHQSVFGCETKAIRFALDQALLRNTYGSKLKVFASDIPQSVRAAEISAEGKSIYAHDPNGKVAAAYRELTKEVMKVEKLRQKHKSDLAR